MYVTFSDENTVTYGIRSHMYECVLTIVIVILAHRKYILLNLQIFQYRYFLRVLAVLGVRAIWTLNAYPNTKPAISIINRFAYT